jgi:23S rRNA pseudouridine2605 synthase
MKTSRGPGRVTLPRALSKLGLSSRSQALRLIEEGLVSVNKTVERNPHRWVDIDHDRIEVSNQLVKRSAFRYILLNKPAGFVTTNSDERGQRTVYDVLGSAGKGLSAAGRLDKESTGLLLFTDDHQLANTLTSPGSDFLKTYVVILDRPIAGKDLLHLGHGVDIEINGKIHRTKSASVSQTTPGTLEIGITEGKNRQVSRMMSALGYEVISLRRISLGTLRLGELQEGQFRELTTEEVRVLKGVKKPVLVKKKPRSMKRR